MKKCSSEMHQFELADPVLLADMTKQPKQLEPRNNKGLELEIYANSTNTGNISAFFLSKCFN